MQFKKSRPAKSKSGLRAMTCASSFSIMTVTALCIRAAAVRSPAAVRGSAWGSQRETSELA